MRRSVRCTRLDRMTALAPAVRRLPSGVVRRGSDGRRARRDAAVRTATGSALWLALLLVTYWWGTGGGGAGGGGGLGGGWAGALTSLGRLTGLVAAVLLLAQVLAMARVPLLESAYGQDRLAR